MPALDLAVLVVYVSGVVGFGCWFVPFYRRSSAAGSLLGLILRRATRPVAIPSVTIGVLVIAARSVR